MVGPKKQAFCPRINMLKGNFDTNYFELLMILSSWSTKSWLSWFSMWNIWNTVWIRCCLQLLGFWKFFVFFWFFLLKLVYFWTESRKNTYGCFFHSICVTELKFGAKNNVRTRQSTLKTLIFANYWGSVPSQRYRYQKNILQRLIFL